VVAVVAVLADIPAYAPAPEPGAAVQPHSHPVVRRAAHRPSPAVLRRRRVVAVIVLATLLLGCWLGLQAALGRIGGGPLATTGAPGGLQPAAGRVWIVRPGDTLWSIAEAADPGSDVRPLVDRLAATLGSTELYPGEAVALPPR
jgi:hypothetical protein